MNVDRLKGRWMQLRGELKRRWGKLTRNDAWQYEGSYDKIIGLLQERYGSDSIKLIRERYGGNKDDLIRWAERWQWKSAPDAQEKQTKHFHSSLKEKTMTTRYILTLCAALVIGGALITGSANALGKTDEKTPINDSWLTAKTKIALFADARIKGSEINVATTQGAMVIRGKVDSDAAKQAAEGIAKGIDGVKSVQNDLQVVAPSKREATDDKDETITARVNEQFAKDAQLNRAAIRTQTNAGVVSLTGVVQDLMTSAQASWSAWQVPGVKSVKNDLTVKEKA